MKALLKETAALCSLWLAATAALARDYADLTLEQAFDALESSGLSILYSSDLVKPGMRVLRPPLTSEPRTILEEIVRPHGLAVINGPNGSVLLVRAKAPDPGESLVNRRGTRPQPELVEVIVTASRYELFRIEPPSFTSLDGTQLELLPNLGDDPLRTLPRLPGAASDDISAKPNVRGGGTDEMLVRFDGLRLHNPFHLKDFRSVFSAIDPALVRSIDVYTGGFPAQFGDRMSGVIDIDSIEVGPPAHRELSFSLFHASALAAGRFDDDATEWLVSARRGNLDLVFDIANTRFGEPGYMDFYARGAHRYSDRLAISANLLVFEDDILLNDSDREEIAEAGYHDRHAWLRFDYEPSDTLAGHLLIARSELDSERQGTAGQPGVSSGWLEDRRSHTINTLQINAEWRPSARTSWEAGVEWRHGSGRYDYSDQLDLDLLFITPGAAAERSRERQLRARPSGDQLGLYSKVRVEMLPRLIADAGVRWDHSTFGDSDGDINPRMSVLHPLNERTRLRASWGRFSQMQGIDELEISDGVVEFSGSQRADHWVLSAEHSFDSGADLRIEAYRKSYHSLRPRFENLLNTMVVLPELKPDRIRIAPDSALARGVEISLRQMTARPLFWWAGYSWSKAEDRFRGVEVRRSWDQRHAISAGIGWESDRWQLSVAGAYHSGWPTTAVELVDIDDEPVAVAPRRNTRRLRSFFDIDARVARNFHLGDTDTLTVFFELSNALDRRNVCCVEYEVEEEEDAERQFVLENVRTLPLLPSLGFIWRF